MSKEDINKRVNDIGKVIRSIETVAGANREYLSKQAYANIDAFLRGQLEIALSSVAKMVVDTPIQAVGEFSIDTPIAEAPAKLTFSDAVDNITRKIANNARPAASAKANKINEGKFEGYIAKGSPDDAAGTRVVSNTDDIEDEDLAELLKKQVASIGGVDFLEE